MSTLAPLLLGFAFGWLLQKAGLTRYDRIVGVFRFADLAVLKFLLSAIVVGAIGVQALVSLGLAGPLPIAPTYVWGNLLGGLLHGVGMALVGLCPGTVVAGAAEGSLDYLVGGGAGLVAGALVFGLTYPAFFPWLSRQANYGAVTFAGLLGASPWLVIVVFAEVTVLLFYFIERGVARRAGAGGATTSA